MTIQTITQAEDITEEMVASYQSQGFIRIPNLLTPEEVGEYHQAALGLSERMKNLAENTPLIFTQYVNAWTQDEKIRQLTLHPRIAAIARRLAGVPLRIWHDHVLIKPPRKGAPTEFHQDAPYWPHINQKHSLSVWIALVDVPVERGCMSFIPGSFHLQNLRPQDLANSYDLLSIAPELNWEPRVTVPLHAGDCTFHHSYIAHMANANITDEPRVAHIVIYMDGDTKYDGKPHPVTDPLKLETGQPLEGDLFPLV